jgi:hypothetical protein
MGILLSLPENEMLRHRTHSVDHQDFVHKNLHQLPQNSNPAICRGPWSCRDRERLRKDDCELRKDVGCVAGNHWNSGDRGDDPSRD